MKKLVCTLLTGATFGLGTLSASAQGTAFTYQGRLAENGSAYTGNVEFQPTLWDALSGGAAVASNQPTTVIVGVTNGLFTLPLDFGANFPGAARWLQLQVRTAIGPFTTVTPRQQLTATPYAITAGSVVSGGLPTGTYSNALTLSNPANQISGNGANVTDVNAATLGGLSATSFWRLFGNAGTTPGTHFLGTTDNLPLEFKVNGQRALRIESATNSFYGYSPNILGGHPANIVSNGIEGAVIGGGGYPGSPNRVGGFFATVVGGAGNTASGGYSTAMGFGSTASGLDSTAIGSQTTASGSGSTAMGSGAQADHYGSFVWADPPGGHFNSTANNQFSVRASGGVRLAANVEIGTNSSDYHQLRIGGGNSFGYLYGSFPRFGDGIHLGYNYYATAGGGNQVIHLGGGTSRISVGYGYIGLGTGAVGAAPTSDQLVVNTSSVTVNGTFNNNSDRNAKQDFEAINPAEILDKVIQLPLSEWSYKTDAATRHIGPMAQDFHAAFHVGTDDKHIAPIDEGGVALAAIQGLNQKLEVRSRELEDRGRKLEAENAELKQRLEALEKIIRNQKSVCFVEE